MENRKRIENFVSGIYTVVTAKENLRVVKESIEIYEKHGEEVYKNIFSRSNYSLEDLKYFRKLLNRKIKDLKEKEKEEYAVRCSRVFVCH